MSTTPIRCPICNALLRVAVQPSFIDRIDERQLEVRFDDQRVAHICPKKSDA